MSNSKDMLAQPNFQEYTPNIQVPTFGDQLLKGLGFGNNVDMKNMNNQYEFWKASNINKYKYNVMGMLQAGINPLIYTSGLSSNVSSPISTQFNSSGGVLGDFLKKTIESLLSYIKPLSREDLLKLISNIL